jgi:hypothetical protein
MGKNINLSIKDIIKRTIPLIYSEDIILFCEDEQTQKEIQKYFEKENSQEILDFLSRIDEEDTKNNIPNNKRRVNKEKFVLLIVNNYKNNIELMKNKLKKLQYQNINKADNREFKELSLSIKIQEQRLKEATNIGKGIETIIPLFHYNNNTKRYDLDIIDSRIEIDNKKIKNNERRKKFKKVDDELRENGFFGIENILQAIFLSDLFNVSPSKEFGLCLREKILTDEFIKQGIVSEDDLYTTEEKDTQKYVDACDKFNFESALPHIKDKIEEYIDYIDIDKLLLIALYRIERGLEGKIINADSETGVELLMNIINKNIPNDLNFDFSMEDTITRDGTFKRIQYSASEIPKCLERFTSNGKYLSKDEVKEYKEKLLNGELTLYDIDKSYIRSIFTEEEFDKVINLCAQNFSFYLENADINSEQIEEEIIIRGKCETELLLKLINMKKIETENLINLYENNLISIEQMQELNLDFSKNISIQKLINLYKLNIQKDAIDTDKTNYDKYLKLCKLTANKEQCDENKKLESSNKYMEEIIVNFDEDNADEYINAIEEFYKAGLINLETIVEWNSDKILIPLLERKIIELGDIKKIYGKKMVSPETIGSIMLNLVKEEDISYEQRLKYIKSGYISQNDIFELYNNNLIFDNDMDELAKMSIINQQDYNELLRKKTRIQAEKESAIVLKGLNYLTKINNEIYDNSDNPPVYPSKKPQNIIDPNHREAFIELFGAVKAQTDVEEDSPFYNYVFYAIPNLNGKIDLDTIVIAERYYENKQTEERFAINNATYIFKYKDLMVLSRLKKSEMTKARKNIVFTANHTLATDKREGHWATNTLFGIIKAMMSSNLDEYSEENKRKIIIEKMYHVYSENEINEILKKLGEIDSGKYNCEIINPNVTRRKIKNTPDFDDNDGDDAR